MQQPDQSGESSNLRQRSALAHSLAYLSIMAAIIEAANAYMMRRDGSPYTNIHPPAFPFVVATTYAFTGLTPADRAAWHQPPTRQEFTHLGIGMAGGTAAMSVVLAIAAARGWVSAPAWGWKKVPPAQVARSVARLTVCEMMAAWNEEMVFRGYGLDTLSRAIGLPAAVLILAPLFGISHGLDPARFVSMTLAGIVLTIMRLESGGIWPSFGFHLMWNLWQVAVFGPSDGPVSLRPLHVHGPAVWVGRPGAPEPGRLVLLVLGFLAVVLGVRVWQRRQRQARSA